MKIAAAYIRVSTDDQIEYSPDSQRKAILDYAKRNGYIVPEEYIFVDEGISGRSTKRPAFQQMIGTAKQKSHHFDTILVWKFSRFARNREDSVVYKSMLRKQCGVDVVSISEQIGEDKTAILIEALLKAMDEYYSINLSEEVVRGMSEKARRGGTLGGAPFGYSVQDGRLIPNDDAPTVLWLFTQFATGMGMQPLARELNHRGIRTKYGNLWENRTVEYLLRNPTYTGTQHWTPGGTKHKKHAETITDDTIFAREKHEAIVPDELFRQVQQRLDELKVQYKRYERKSTEQTFLSKGLLRCSSCGGPMGRSAHGGVQCQQYTKGRCDVSHYIKQSMLETLLVQQIKDDLKTGNFKTAVLPDDRRTDADDRTDSIRKQLERAQRKLQRVREAYEAGVDTLDEYRENKRRISEEIAALEQALSVKPAPAKRSTKSLREIVESSVVLLQSDVPVSLKNDVLHTFVSQIVFDRKASGVSVTYCV